MSGTYRTSLRGPGEVDLTAQLTRGDPREVYHYLPNAIHEPARAWIRRALAKGEVTDARLKLAGDLAKFPFAEGKGGQFIVTAKARGVTLDFADQWPPIEGIDGDIRFEGASMTIDAARGRLFGAQIGRTRASIADLRAAPPHLSVEGTATGPVGDFLRFVAESPVDAMTGHVIQGAEGAGEGKLTLGLDLLLGQHEGHRIGGEFSFVNTQFKLPGVPRLSQLNGRFGFSNGEMTAREITAEVAGGPARFAVGTVDGRIRLTGTGTANLASLRREYPSPFAARVSGLTDWTIAADVRSDVSTLVFETSLKGAVIDLPAPLGKGAGASIPLRIALREDGARPDEDIVEASYGRTVQVLAHRIQRGSDMRVDRAVVALGSATGRPGSLRAEEPGVWVRGDLPVLSVDDWLALRERDRGEPAPSKATEDEGAELSGVDLDVGALEVFGRRFNEFKVVGRRSLENWQLDLRGRDVTGTAAWSAPNRASPNGRVVARLSRFSMPGAGELPQAGGTDKPGEPKTATSTIDQWPELDIAADSFVSKGRDLGHLEVVAQPRGSEWRIEKLALSNDAGRIDANGAWRNVGRQQQTRLEATLEAKDGGAFLSRIGYAEAVKGGPTTVTGQLAWAGSPTEFDYPTLSGEFRLVVGSGRFTKIEPGIGKLLGVLSLQALPRRVSLDFQDVFSEGFAFDQITGDVRVADGVMHTDNLRLVGPAAKVDIAGEADLAKETRAPVGARSACALLERLGRRRVALPRESDGRRRRRCGLAPRAKRAQGSDRADVQLPIYGDRRMVGSRGDQREDGNRERRSRGQDRRAPAMTARRGDRNPALKRVPDVARVPFRVAAVQMISGGDVGANLAAAGPLVAEAAGAGARLVVLPEYFGIFGRAGDRQGRRARAGWRRRAAGVPLRRGEAPWHLARRRHGADRDRGSRARAKRVPCLWSRRPPDRTLRQDPSLRIHARRRALRRRTHDRPGHATGRDRAPLRTRRPLGVLRRALSRALSRPRRACADPRAVGVHRDHRCRALAPAAACARRRKSVLRPRGGAGRHASGRTADVRSLGADRSLGPDRRRARGRRGDRRRRHRSRAYRRGPRAAPCALASRALT